MSTATPAEFETVYNTNLDDPEIQESLDYADDLNQEYNTVANQTTIQTRYIEIHAAAVNIRTHKERSVDQESGGGYSATYEGDELSDARQQLRSWIDRAGGDLAMADAIGGVVRDTSRHVAQTDES